MNGSILILFKILEITFLDLALCGDNIGVIALATRNLPEKPAKIASIIGISGAIFMRIYFACIISLFFKAQWLPIKLIGGIILIKVTWDLIKPQVKKENHVVKHSERFWDAVLAVILADISMSLDNVLAITSAANGNILLITFGILLNIPIIFLGSRFVASIMKKYPIVIYIGGSILAFTSLKMILADRLFKLYIHIPSYISQLMPWIATIVTIGYGFFMVTLYHNEDSTAKIRKAS